MAHSEYHLHFHFTCPVSKQLTADFRLNPSVDRLSFEQAHRRLVISIRIERRPCAHHVILDDLDIEVLRIQFILFYLNSMKDGCPFLRFRCRSLHYVAVGKGTTRWAAMPSFVFPLRLHHKCHWLDEWMSNSTDSLLDKRALDIEWWWMIDLRPSNIFIVEDSTMLLWNKHLISLVDTSQWAVRDRQWIMIQSISSQIHADRKWTSV